tara:strand:- start:171 stop:641 length:471 start_codon:yes stop_codon:yes gene_type:complete
MKHLLLTCLAGTVLAQFTWAEDIKIPRTPSPKGAKVEILMLKNGRTVRGPVRVVFGLKGMGVSPAGLVLPDGKPKENTGHHHLLVNAKQMPAMNLPLAASETLIHFGGGQTETVLNLPPGEHTLQLVFADFAHIPHDPPVISKQITIKVEAPKKKK